jgi:hypothetical protein
MHVAFVDIAQRAATMFGILIVKIRGRRPPVKTA